MEKEIQTTSPAETVAETIHPTSVDAIQADLRVELQDALDVPLQQLSRDIISFKTVPGLSVNNISAIKKSDGKYVILQLECGTVVILVQDVSVFKFHVQAVYHFMKENNIESVCIAGGGLIELEGSRPFFYGTSDAFGTPSEADQKFAQSLMDCKANWQRPRDKKQSLSEGGGLKYSFQSIKEKAMS